MFKRIALFLLTNILVLISVSVVMTLLGVQGRIGENGFMALVILSVTIGFSGAIISLMISRISAKWIMKVKTFDESTAALPHERFILNEVKVLSRQAGLFKIPEVGIYPSSEINAFATGPSKKRSLVALSSGLAEMGDTQMLRGIIAHEIAHIKNGDMVTMTLLQGVINSLVIMLSRLAANLVSTLVKPELSGLVYFVTAILFDILFSILSSPLIFWHSRKREFKADKLGAELGGRDAMIYALEKLKLVTGKVDTSQKSIAAFKISGGHGKMNVLFSTHPPLEKRIQALKNM